jgi:long-chain acyl-CoA synthetase
MEERPWFKSYDPGMPHTLQPYPEHTLLEVVSETVQQRPEHTAFIFKGRRMSYAELEQFSNAFAAALVELGVQKGERVALLIPNSPQAVIAQLGAWKAGAIVCPLNSLYTASELEFALRDVSAQTVVVLTPFYDKVKSIQKSVGFTRLITTNIKDHLSTPLRLLFTLLKEKKEGHHIQLQPGDHSMIELLKRYANASRPAVTVGPKDSAILLFSGGTTGLPKAALGSHHALLMSAMQLHAYARGVLQDWDDPITLCMPMFHVYGNMGMCTSLVARWPMALVPNPRDLDDLIATIRKTRPAVLHGVPTLFNSLLNHPDVLAGKVDFKSMKICYSAAAPLLAETKQRFEALTGGRLLEAYAMTETMLAAVACPVHGAYKEGSTGVPITDVEVRITDVETGEGSLPAMEVGEILIRAPQVMVGYWERPTETANMIRDGWVYTGDIGYMDSDGYLFIVDRKKDLIKPSGFQVWPREVEEVIATYPAVADVCVAGVPDVLQGEAVKAWVVLKAGERSMNAEARVKEIQDHCRTSLVAYKIPKEIEFREDLPKTLVGKTLRRMLKEEKPVT